MRPLPPFAELVAFEAVARHLSFTRAAAELCLTQSAISHRVRRLETHYGTLLIRRLNPGIALTDAGAALLPELAAALDALSRLNGGGRERRLRVAAGSALCSWWLAGRLASFMAHRPGLSVELIPIENADTPVPEVDVRILWVTAGAGEVHAPTQRPLFAEHVFPVCSPKLLPQGRPLRDAAALAALPLLHKSGHGSGEWSWALWLDRLGAERARKRGSELRFTDMGLILSAAVDGAGVALSRSLLVHDALRAGRLVVPLPGLEPMVSTKHHVARWRRARAGDPDIEVFVDWLAAEAEISLADVARRLGVIQAPAKDTGEIGAVARAINSRRTRGARPAAAKAQSRTSP